MIFKQIAVSFLVGFVAALLTAFFTGDTDIITAVGTVAGGAMLAKFMDLI